MRDVFCKALLEAAKCDPRIMLITGDLGFAVFDEFQARFPAQFLNIGVAEQNMTGVAAGMALEGRVVFTYSIGNFPTLRCLEQIRNNVCYHNLNVKIVCVGGGMSYGSVGVTHHATEDLAILRSLPNMIVLSPGDLWEAEEATKAVIAHDGPAYLRLDKSNAPASAIPPEGFSIGSIRVVRPGFDITLAATGGIVGEALLAADLLERQNIQARVLSVHTVKPLDNAALVAAARETGGIVSIEEHGTDGGLGGAIAETLLESGVFPRSFTRLGLRSCFSSVVGSQQFLRETYGLDAHAIAQTARRTVATAHPLPEPELLQAAAH